MLLRHGCKLTIMKPHAPSFAIILLAAALMLTGCAADHNPLDDYRQLEPATILEAPETSPSDYDPERVAQGRYLVGLLGCGSCHTDGALAGTPVPERALAGSRIGIAYSNPLAVRNPGVVYPANLTPDPATGIGNQSVEQLVAMIREGTDEHGNTTLPVMPWPAYSDITIEDARAIAMYLKSLPPVRHPVPEDVSPGQRAPAPFVHFGVYQGR